MPFCECNHPNDPPCSLYGGHGLWPMVSQVLNLLFSIGKSNFTVLFSTFFYNLYDRNKPTTMSKIIASYVIINDVLFIAGLVA